MSRRALVTGAAGFVGANLVRRLLRDGHEVTAVCRSDADLWRLDDVLADLRVETCDLRDSSSVSRVAQRVAPDSVFHLAAHGAYSWQDDPVRIFETNVLGTVHLAEATRDAGAFIHAGSSSEYGLKDHPPSESAAIAPNSDYAVAKAAATLWLQQRSRGVTLRLYSAYGPWEEPRRLVPTLLAHALRGTLPPLVSPDVARDFVYVGDVCEAFVLAVEAAPGSVLNVASGRQTTIADLVAVVRRQLDVSDEPQWGTMPERRWDTSTWVGDARRIASDLGWRADTDLESGLEQTAAWMRRERAFERQRG